MEKLTLNDLLAKVAEYNIENLEIVKKAYYYAEELHRGQKRQSGEDYIVHPLNVAYILAEMYADKDTICAALLHDTLEDTEITKEQIAKDFNETVSYLVDGVTKISRMNFSTKEEQNMANTRKIITSMRNDIRIIIIKLADRLHNMRTLQYKSEDKQKENSQETLLLYVRLADRIGLHVLKRELEDLSLQYINNDEYNRIKEMRLKVAEDSKECIQEMLGTINDLLNNQNIPHEEMVRIKNIYGIYKKIQRGYRLTEIHDLLSLKVIVDNINDCYPTLRWIHWKYKPINRKFKDYISVCKPNGYQSLHTTIFGEDGRLVQTQIRTPQMNQVASYGLAANWGDYPENANLVMQQEWKTNDPFYDSLVEIDSQYANDKEFVDQVYRELLGDRISVYTQTGKLELPKGATPIDVAYNIHTEVGNNMVGAIINGKEAEIGKQLKQNDNVRIITDDTSIGPNASWLTQTATTKAKRKIKEAIRI
ncbi:MAG: RelA/SpoT family protein [Candidatus Faecimonas sp.]|nr:RelA/SpoT family protein [Mycoplasmatota bacterium]MDY2907809.1 RelA/SpoT family protein [Candidatus Faecimonas sp.]